MATSTASTTPPTPMDAKLRAQLAEALRSRSCESFAQEHNLPVDFVRQTAREMGLVLRRGRRPDSSNANLERDREVVECVTERGMPTEEIAKSFGISRQRTDQILHSMGMHVHEHRQHSGRPKGDALREAKERLIAGESVEEVTAALKATINGIRSVRRELIAERADTMVDEIRQALAAGNAISDIALNLVVKREAVLEIRQDMRRIFEAKGFLDKAVTVLKKYNGEVAKAAIKLSCVPKDLSQQLAKLADAEHTGTPKRLERIRRLLQQNESLKVIAAAEYVSVASLKRLQARMRDVE